MVRSVERRRPCRERPGDPAGRQAGRAVRRRRIAEVDRERRNRTDRTQHVLVFLAIIATVATLLVAGIVKIEPGGDSLDASPGDPSKRALAGDGTDTTSTTLPPIPPPTAPGGVAPAISRVETTEKVLFLGIDDGLVRDPAVLDYLAANDIPFTSFLQANLLDADPAFWARHRAIGGAIQSHTLTHPNLTKLGADQVREQVCGSADAIARSTGVRPILFRPPYGAYNATVQAIAAECGYVALVLWKGATNDGRVDLQEKVLKPGDILLMHWRPDLLVNLQNVVALARSQGFRIAKLESYLAPIP